MKKFLALALVSVMGITGCSSTQAASTDEIPITTVLTSSTTDTTAVGMAHIPPHIPAPDITVSLNGAYTTPIVQGDEVYISLDDLAKAFNLNVEYFQNSISITTPYFPWISGSPSIPSHLLAEAQYINQATVVAIDRDNAQVTVLPYGLPDNIYNYIQLNLSYDTLTTYTLSEGMTVAVAHAPLTTRSTIPQATAYYIVPINIVASTPSLQMNGVEIIEIMQDAYGWKITVGDVTKPASLYVFAINNDTSISHYMNKSRYFVEDLAVGLKVNITYAPESTMTLPPQSLAYQIEILGPSN